MRLALRIGAGVELDPDSLRHALSPTLRRLGWHLVADPPLDGPPDLVLRIDGDDPGPDDADPGRTPVLRVPFAGPDAHRLDTLPLVLDGAAAGLRRPADRTEQLDVPGARIDWYEPDGTSRGVAVLVHGGYYRSRWTSALMTRLAVDLAARGWTAANLEYRRPDRHGWPATQADLRAALARARAAAGDRPLLLVGHSAGGQLVLQAAQEHPGVDLAVSLAGVVDLRAAHDRALGEGAVGAVLGSPADHPARYAAASPAAFTSRRVPWLLVQGRDDSVDLVEMNRRLAGRADLGHPGLIEGPGDHFAVIDPDAPIWVSAADRIDELLDPGRAHPLDRADPAPERAAFHLPRQDGRPVAYLAANALGLQSGPARDAALAELDVWRDHGHGGHYAGERPWTRMTDALREPVGAVVGALPSETLAANGLTVNLHLLMASFYRPHGRRTRILTEAHAFPSDRFAVRSHLGWHGRGDADLLELAPRAGEETLRTRDVLEVLRAEGDTIALVLLGGVNFLTGELLDIPVLTAAAHAAGAVVGWDLAHAAGNVELALHDWGVDWAAWCTYKYLNGGPGATAGLFVHERHHADAALPRLAGWYGQRVDDRFGDHDHLRPSPDAEAWQISNPAVLALAPVLASVQMFARHGMTALAARSRRLTGHLERALAPLVATGALVQLTPADPARRGAQLSYRVRGRSSADVVHRLETEYGVVADARTPDVLRLAPAALSSSYADCDRAVVALRAVLLG